MFDCEEFLKCLSDYFDGELDELIRVDFEAHLRECKNARVVMRTLERTIVLHRGMQQRKVPADVHARLIDAIEKCRRAR